MRTQHWAVALVKSTSVSKSYKHLWALFVQVVEFYQRSRIKNTDISGPFRTLTVTFQSKCV